MLADTFIVGRKIEQDFRTLQCQRGTGRYGCPQIFAYLHSESGICRFEQQVSPHRNNLPAKAHTVFCHITCGSKPALLIKLLIIGKISLRDNAQHSPLLNDNRRIQQHTVQCNGHAQYRNDIHLARIVQNLYQPHFRLFEQKLLGKEVATSISGNAQLRKSNDLHTFPVGYNNLFFNL